MKDPDNFLSFTELKERFDVKTNFLVYQGLVSCIKLLRNTIENQNEANSTFVENFIKAPKANRLAYKKLVSAKKSCPTKTAKKNGVRTAVFSAPRQSIGRWLTNYLSTALKLPN